MGIETFGDRGRAVAGVGELLLERWEGVLAVGALDVGDELSPLEDEEGSPLQGFVTSVIESLRLYLKRFTLADVIEEVGG
jgi:hypothetical protein